MREAGCCAKHTAVQMTLGGYVMLYHWYELDLESPDATNRSSPPSHDHADKTRYCSLAAKAEATGASCRIVEMPDTAVAANDTSPDRVAEQLREIGIGSLCNPIFSAQPGDYDLLPQISKRLNGLASWFATQARRLSVIAPTRRRDIKANREHTIVSNSIDDHPVASDDARRQRFELAGQQ